MPATKQREIQASLELPESTERDSATDDDLLSQAGVSPAQKPPVAARREPVRTRPRWLAWVLRVLRIPDSWLPRDI